MIQRMATLFILYTLFLTGCASHYASSPAGEELINISIIDRNGTSETISTKERLEKYDKVDFLSPQPYEKVHRNFSQDSKGHSRSAVTSYHPNGQVEKYLQVLNNRAFGTYQEWYEDGTPKINARVVGGSADLTPEAQKSWLFDGTSIARDNQGRIQAEINYEKGALHGPSTHYHPNGKIWKALFYSKGLQEGVQRTFFEDGTLFAEAHFSKGTQEGESVRLWRDGSKATHEVYQSGLLIEGQYRTAGGELIASIVNGTGQRALFGKNELRERHQYIEGSPCGKVEIFSHGELVRSYSIQNGEKQGEEFFYYPTQAPNSPPQPRLMISWRNNIIHGEVKSWYKNGTLESQKEMSQNKKQGIASAWYEEGELMLIEEYHSDKLIRGEYRRKGELSPISTVVNGCGAATLFDPQGNLIQKIPYEQGIPSI